MQFGFFACTRTRVAELIAAATVAVLPIAASAQPYGDFGQSGPPAGQTNNRAVQAYYTAPSGSPNGSPNGGRQSSYTDSYGNPLIEPAQYCQGGDGYGNGCGGNCGGCGGCNGGCYGPANGGCYGGGCGCGQGQCGGGFNGCMPIGAGGTDPPVGYNLMEDAGQEGNLVDQRGPHYFDVRAEAVYLHRDTNFERDIDFTSLNVGNTVVLNSHELDLNDRTGFRIIGRYDICPLAVVEFGYTGVFDFSDKASVNDPSGNLFSLFSRTAPGTGLFGVSPVGVNLPNGPNPESERATRQSISLNSDLQSAEISYRRYWLGYVPRVSGTLLAGFRYTRMDDNFLFATEGSEPATADPTGPLAALRYNEQCENNLAGFQTGGDIWVSLFQGLRIGSEGKVGLYNNHYSLTNRISTTPTGTTPPSLNEQFTNNKAAFLTEGSVDLVADVLPTVSIRVGYEVLFMDSLVLAGENFNETSPYGNQGTRVPFVKDDGQLFYHGAHAGIEYTW